MKRDEEIARHLLQEHLRVLRADPVDVALNPTDPPDLIVTLTNGDRWGVEVTRSYQQVERMGMDKRVSVPTTTEFMRLRAEELDRDSRDIRKRDYVISLQGPGVFSTWDPKDTASSWWKRTRPKLVKHIESGSSDKLRLPGVSLRPKGPGNVWSILLEHPIAELTPTIWEMVDTVVGTKGAALERWGGNYTSRRLLVLNAYVLADDATAIEAAVRDAIKSRAPEYRFDAVYWSGCRDREIMEIRLR
jgi:hypothetical protein